MPTAPARPMPMKAVGIAAPASELELLSEPELPEPEEPVAEEEPPVLVVEPEPELERLVLRLVLELPAMAVLLVPMRVPLAVLMMVPVPMTVGAEVIEVALEMAVEAADSALLTSEEAAAVREETPAASVGTR